MSAAAAAGVLSGNRANILSPYDTMDYLWDGAGIGAVGGFATGWVGAIGGVVLTQVQVNGCNYQANWRNGESAIVSTTGRLQSATMPNIGGTSRIFLLAGQFPSAVANGAYKGISMYSGKPFPFILAGGAGVVRLESWEETLDGGLYAADMSAWLGLPFFAVVRHELGAYRMMLRVAGATHNLPKLAGPDVVPSNANGIALGGTTDANNEWDAAQSMFGIRVTSLTNYQMEGLCNWSTGAPFGLP
jgi:hypothetical protein